MAVDICGPIVLTELEVIATLKRFREFYLACL